MCVFSLPVTNPLIPSQSAKAAASSLQARRVKWDSKLKFSSGTSLKTDLSRAKSTTKSKWLPCPFLQMKSSYARWEGWMTAQFKSSTLLESSTLFAKLANLDWSLTKSDSSTTPTPNSFQHTTGRFTSGQ